MDLYAVIGNPIQHSLSPTIHAMFAEQSNQQLAYDRILVPLDGLPEALSDFQKKGGKGLNITLPFKQDAFSLVNAHTERALLAGAINTIRFNSDGSCFGDNTDGVGFIRDLTIHHHFSIKEKRVLILGAGGSVRGILKPILDESPSEVVIANRTENKAADLAEAFSQYGSVRACSLHDLAHASFDLIVNATSASLQQDNLILPDGLVKKGGCCYDLVYGKGITPFLQWAQQQNAALATDGLGMLVEQAAESFYLWRNVRPDTRLVLTKLAEQV